MAKDNELKHLAIIMDGNGRWAKQRGNARAKGHKEGAKVAKNLTEYIANERPEIKFLTLYAFSTENWNRPTLEVNALMKLLERYMKDERENFIKNDIRFRFIGDESKFSNSLKKELYANVEATKDCKRLTQVLALNYGSQDEIIRAMRKMSEKGEEINKENLEKNLDTSFAGNVDLLIRTGGEQRLSNYLLWQSAYAELRFCDTLWPDFTPKELDEIINSYKKTHRRFGGL